MKKAIFLVGNFGVGKSTLLNRQVISSVGIYQEIAENLYVLGKDTSGADTLSSFKKEDVIKDIISNKDKNIILCGIYYQQIIDVQRLKNFFEIVIVYLNTDYENNKKRIESRGKEINKKTFLSKNKHIKSFIKQSFMDCSDVFIIDNNKSKEEVKKEFDNIIKKLLYEKS
jgi:dephospho-CoA kinase